MRDMEAHSGHVRTSGTGGCPVDFKQVNSRRLGSRVGPNGAVTKSRFAREPEVNAALLGAQLGGRWSAVGWVESRLVQETPRTGASAAGFCTQRSRRPGPLGMVSGVPCGDSLLS